MTDYIFPLFHTLLQQTTHTNQHKGCVNDDSHTHFVVRLALGNNIAPMAKIVRQFLEKKHAARLYKRVVNDVADMQHAEAEAIAQAKKCQYQQTLEDAKEQANVVLMFPEDEHLLLWEKKELNLLTNHTSVK